MGLNKELIGKEYEPQEYTVTAEEAKKYALGYNEDLPLFTDESHPQGMIAPQMIGVKYTGPCVAQAFFDPDLGANIARLVHGEQEFEFHDVVRPRDVITTEGEIVDIQIKEKLDVVTLKGHSTNQDGVLVCSSKFTFVIRK